MTEVGGHVSERARGAVGAAQRHGEASKRVQGHAALERGCARGRRLLHVHARRWGRRNGREEAGESHTVSPPHLASSLEYWLAPTHGAMATERLVSSGGVLSALLVPTLLRQDVLGIGCPSVLKRVGEFMFMMQRDDGQPMRCRLRLSRPGRKKMRCQCVAHRVSRNRTLGRRVHLILRQQPGRWHGVKTAVTSGGRDLGRGDGDTHLECGGGWTAG